MQRFSIKLALGTGHPQFPRQQLGQQEEDEDGILFAAGQWLHGSEFTITIPLPKQADP
jgi:hypothetical protein